MATLLSVCSHPRKVALAASLRLEGCVCMSVGKWWELVLVLGKFGPKLIQTWFELN